MKVEGNNHRRKLAMPISWGVPLRLELCKSGAAFRYVVYNDFMASQFGTERHPKFNDPRGDVRKDGPLMREIKRLIFRPWTLGKEIRD